MTERHTSADRAGPTARRQATRLNNMSQISHGFDCRVIRPPSVAD